MTLAAAYAFCRDVAKREAKNFYWSFRVLPRAKSDAMCAIYAFMRQADDLADDETRTVGARREALDAWRTAWHASRETGRTEDPVFLALADTQIRFHIADGLLEDLVRGTAMDLEEGSGTAVELGDGLQGYRTFEDLYRYCYLVASVVGLVCIKVFGYRDSRAELLAERTGVAFQLTNILRDVKEDAERRRIYLPQDMLAQTGVTNADIVAAACGGPVEERQREVIATLSAGAWDFYRSAGELLPMIDADSRAALWVMVEIYSRLLREVDALHGDVFRTRARVPTGEKMLVLAQGAAMALRARVR